MKLRILTDTHYELDDGLLHEHYGTDDPTEIALAQQEILRDDGSALFEMMAEENTETQIYVQVFDPGGQMFTDEFVREVIQIILLQDFEIHINSHSTGDRSVHASVTGLINGIDQVKFHGWGRTIGFALRDIREQLRQMTGK